MQTIGLEVEAVLILGKPSVDETFEPNFEVEVTPDTTPVLKTPEEANKIRKSPEIQPEKPSTSAGDFFDKEKENQQPGASAITNNTQQ